MRAAGFFLKTAFTQIRRGGQRNLVAFLCVAFGVMSLVTMTTMAKSIEKMLVLKPFELIGGDLTLDREGEDSISAAEEAELMDLKSSGQISDFTLMDYSNNISFRKPESGELFFPAIGMGVDTEKYPLAGALTISDPVNKSLAQLLAAPGDVIITRDLALAYKLNVNDKIILSNLDFGQPLDATIRGIASDTPNHQGSKVYYSHETSYAMTGVERTANTVLVNTTQQDETARLLEASGWRVFTSQFLAQATAASEGTIAMMLNDIGLLGLLVSGIGIANTMQVLLKRRRKEVAIWKTLGYTAGKIQAMFITEAAILGFSGSLLGAGLGVLLSYGLVGLFSRITTLLMHWSFSPIETLSGLVIGTITTIIFALWAIVSTSKIRPLALLRSEALLSSQIPAGQGILLGLLLVVPFLGIAVWVLKSFLIGLLVLFGSILGLMGLAFMLWLLMLLAVKFLPLKKWSLGKISSINLRKRGITQIIAMVALFIGIFTLALGAVITNSGQEVIGALSGDDPVENLAIYAAPSAHQDVENELTKNAIQTYSTGHVYRVNQIAAPAVKDTLLKPALMARSDPGTAVIHGAAWGTRTDGAYAYPYSNIPIGSILQITDIHGEIHEVEVVGTFENGEQASWPGLNDKFMVTEDLGQELGTATNSQFYLTLNPTELKNTMSHLGKALPQTTLLSMPEFQARFMIQYNNLYVMVAVIAGLSILAGLLLVANSVSLAMLDRRFEIGVLKSIGYSRWQVLTSQVVEYTLMSVVAIFTALILIWGMLALTGMLNEMLGSMLMLKPGTAGLIALIGIGFTTLTVLWATWKPCNASPVFVLNDRE
ncbi:FtsX-like permease family protein [bacterium]|nr:FtsX-like permease family protein [bacterium]